MNDSQKYETLIKNVDSDNILKFGEIIRDLPENPEESVITRLISDIRKQSYNAEQLEAIIQNLADKLNKKPATIKRKYFPDEKKNESVSEDVENVSFFETDDKLFEQVSQEGKQMFVAYSKEKNTFEIVAGFHYEGKLYKPIDDEEATKGYIKLPTEPLEYETEAKLDEEIKTYIQAWLDIPGDELQFLVYNIRRSWLFDKFNTLNYARALGDYGTGKSRFLDTIGLIHYKPIATSGVLTPAVLFRVIDKWHGTVILDEADLKFGDETNDVIKIINQGYEKDKFVMRCNPVDPTKIDFFDVYCPKVIATRRAFEDKATESRCITIVMRTTSRKDIPVILTKGFFEKTLELRNKLLMYRLRNYNIVNPDAGLEVDLGDIEPRLKQISVGFVSMFANNPQEVERFKVFINKYQGELAEERSASFEGQIVNAICQIVVENGELTATNIIEKANLTDKQNHPWKPRAISGFMKSLGFGTAKQKWTEEGNKKLFEIDKNLLLEHSKKYLTDQDLKQKVTNQLTVLTLLTSRAENKKSSISPPFSGQNEDFAKGGASPLCRLERLDGYETVRNPENPKAKTYLISLLENTDLVSFEYLESAILTHFPETNSTDLINQMVERGEIFSPKSGFFSLLK